MRKRSTFGAAALLALLPILFPQPFAAEAASPASPPVRLTFDKAASGVGVWEGATGGDISGSLRTELLSLEVKGVIWNVEFDWIVEAGPQSFVARLSGVLNTKTGKVVMNGTVIDGYLEGAQVHEEGQLVDPGTLRFVGSIRLMPSSAG